MLLMASKVEVQCPALPIKFYPSFSVEILQRSIPDFLFRHEKPGRMQRTHITSLFTVQVRISSHVHVGMRHATSVSLALRQIDCAQMLCV